MISGAAYICSGTFEPGSKFSLSMLTRAGSDDDTPGNTNQQPMARETLEDAPRSAFAADERLNEALSEQRLQNALILNQHGSLKQAVKTQPGLTEEGKKARIAPEKLRSCVLMYLAHVITADRQLSQSLRDSARLTASRLFLTSSGRVCPVGAVDCLMEYKLLLPRSSSLCNSR